jgi:hypothetical protein
MYMSVCMYMHKYMFKYMYTYTFTNRYTYTHSYSYMYVYTYIYMYNICIRIRICICKCVQICHFFLSFDLWIDTILNTNTQIFQPSDIARNVSPISKIISDRLPFSPISEVRYRAQSNIGMRG